MITRDDQARKRMETVRFAIENGHGYGKLSYVWNVTTSAAYEWCKRNATPEQMARLAENGFNIRERKRASCDTKDRLELVQLCRSKGWADAKTARAIGFAPSALSNWLKAHAPFGIDDALQDFADEKSEAA